MAKTVITYGTFDLFHYGHARLLARLSGLGDKLIVAVSSDDFNEAKGKTAFIPYEQRAEIVSQIKGVSLVIPENSWAQKELDIKKHNVDVFAIGDDWAGEFDHLKQHCDVLYLPRTPNVSSTDIRERMAAESVINAAQVLSQ